MHVTALLPIAPVAIARALRYRCKQSGAMLAYLLVVCNGLPARG